MIRLTLELPYACVEALVTLEMATARRRVAVATLDKAIEAVPAPIRQQLRGYGAEVPQLADEVDAATRAVLDAADELLRRLEAGQ